MQNLVVDKVSVGGTATHKEVKPSTSGGKSKPSTSDARVKPSTSKDVAPSGGGGMTKKGEEEEEEMEVAPAANDPIPINDQLKAEVALLKGKQLENKCKADVVGVLKPYIDECLRRRAAGKPFINIKKFQELKQICGKCFHPDGGHTRFECGAKCCDTRVCAKCFHSHYGIKCLCGHSQNYLNDLRARMI